MNNANLVVSLLKAAGIERGFGVPSGNVLPLMEAMRTGGIDFVLTAHEGSAGFAADVTSRLSGMPGLCIATLGPGATNLATGVGCAWLDRSPLIAITCTLNEAQLGRRIQMWIDHQALFKPITKASVVLRPGKIVETVRKALRLALTEPQGPVHLDLPEDVALAGATESIGEPCAIAPGGSPAVGLAPALRSGANDDPTVRPERSAAESKDDSPVRDERSAAESKDDSPVRDERSAAESKDDSPVRDERSAAESKDERPAALGAAARLLRSAQRPLAVIGASAMRMQHPALLRQFIERHGVPFATTTMAKGMIDETHALSIGCIERACRQIQRRFIREHADLVIGIGYDTIEVEYEAWVGSIPLLHVDLERADVDDSVTLAHEVTGNLDASVAALVALEPCANAWGAEVIGQHRAQFQAALRPASASFSPHAAIDVVRRVLPRAGVLAFDVGAHTHQIASQWTAHAPRTFLITNGWSSMGFGLPAAIAAKLARPDLPVVCIVGDGCFQMTCGELAVAKRERLAIPFVILDDRWLSLIKVKQERRTLAHYGTELFDEPYQAPPAHYFGVRAVGVRTAAELERALTAALSGDEPTVIEALVDPASYSETVFD